MQFFDNEQYYKCHTDPIQIFHNDKNNIHISLLTVIFTLFKDLLYN